MLKDFIKGHQNDRRKEKKDSRSFKSKQRYAVVIRLIHEGY